MAEANEQFRAARARTASLAHPDECLSRQEVAELANAWLWERYHEKFDLTANYVGKLEQGVIRWPSALYREAFRAIFNVPTDSALRFVNARARSPRAVMKLDDVDDVKRKQLFDTAALGVGTLALGEPMAALLEGSEPIPIPPRIGSTEINQIRAATQVYDSWSRTYGGGIAREAVRGQLRWSAGLLEAICPERLRPELYSAVGNLATVAGYMAYDADAQDEARRLGRFALGCAEQATDWRLRANVLSSMAKQEIWTGQPDDGLTLADLALVRHDRLKASLRALLHTSRACALATMHRVQETLRAIGTADEHFTDANDPSSLSPPRAITSSPANPWSTSPSWATTPARPPPDSPQPPPGTPPTTSAPGRSAWPSWPVSRWSPVTRCRPPRLDTKPWMSPAASAPTSPPRTCASCPATPPPTNTLRRSPPWATGSLPWSAPTTPKEPSPLDPALDHRAITPRTPNIRRLPRVILSGEAQSTPSRPTSLTTQSRPPGGRSPAPNSTEHSSKAETPSARGSADVLVRPPPGPRADRHPFRAVTSVR